MALHPGKLKSRIRAGGLQTRFLLGLASILLSFSILAATLIYQYERKSLEREAFQQTEMIMAAATATRGYIREVLRPAMYEVVGGDGFVLEAMSSSFISRAIMERFGEALPAFEYRRVAINARNPLFEANHFEADLIRYFQEHPRERNWQGIVNHSGGAHYMRFQPIFFSESCLRCHGRPEDAPQAVIDRYGASRGFSQAPGIPLGLVGVGIPVAIGLLKSREIAWTVFGGAFLVAFLLFGAICFFFNKVVVHNIRDLLEVFRSLLRDEKGESLYQRAQDADEIDEMNAVAEVMAAHLRESRKRLEEHAHNLETRVAERTAALQHSERLLRRKITDRNRELQALNTIAELITQSVDLTGILPQVMEQTLQLIPARGCGFYLYRSSPPLLELQYQHQASELPVSLVPFSGDIPPGSTSEFTAAAGEAACGHMSFYGGSEGRIQGLHIPLCCRNQVLGVMTFTGVDYKEIDAETQELLFSIGRQIGITIESLQNMLRLLQSKELLQTIFDGISDPVVLLDGRCRLKMVNRAFRDRYQLSYEEILDRSCRELAGPSCPFAACGDLVQTGLKSAVTREVELAGGEIFEVHFYPVFADEGSIRNIICYGKEITEQKQAEQQAQQTEKLVALGQLAAGVAHEINNPLGVILCHTDLLAHQLGRLPGELADVKTIERHAQSCQRIVADLLNFARGPEQSRRLASINQTIEEVEALVAAQFRKQQIAIEKELAPELPLLEIDIDRLKQVLLNLLMNAFQAMAGSGRIRMETRWRKDGNRVEITVEDNGCGIARDQIDKIFDPFFTTKKPGEGTGLGLSVSYGIVHEHGGDIRAESEPGQWTRFTIGLPVEPERSETDDA